MEGKITIRLKNSFSNHRLNLSLNDERKCKKTTLIKERNPQSGV